MALMVYLESSSMKEGDVMDFWMVSTLNHIFLNVGNIYFGPFGETMTTY